MLSKFSEHNLAHVAFLGVALYNLLTNVKDCLEKKQATHLDGVFKFQNPY